MNTYLCYGDSLTYGYNPATGGKYPSGSWVDYLNQFSSDTFINLGVCGRTIPSSAPRELHCSSFPHAYRNENPKTATCGTVESTPGKRYLWIMLGSNDLLEGLNAREVGQRMEDFLSSLLKESSHKCENNTDNKWQPQNIRLISPVAFKRGTWVESEKVIIESHKLQNVYKALAEKLGLSFTAATEWQIPLQFDGVHFTAEGHRMFARKMRDAGIVSS
ncbi:MAG: GDSL-type esterase/lipase family protein [Eubacterium sp.]|nr:GDSL-type esterase/lipase family protein [Eubacterium sp.]